MKRIITALAIGLLTYSAVAQNYSKDLEKQAKNGNIEAMIELGDAYVAGNGTSKDPKKAEKWYKKAADKGNALACRRMASLYTSWDGLEKNPAKEDEWLRKAANAGDPELGLQLGKDYLYGKNGKDTNYDEAARLLTKAVDNGADKDAYGYLAYALVKSPQYRNYFKAIELSQDQGDGTTTESRQLGDKAKKMAYAALGLHSRVILTENDDPETVIFCTALKICDLYKFNDEMPILKELTKVAFAGKDPRFNYLKGIGSIICEKRQQAIDFFIAAYDAGVEDAGVALVCLDNNTPYNRQRCPMVVVNDPVLQAFCRHLPSTQYDGKFNSKLRVLRANMANSPNEDFQGNAGTAETIDRLRKKWASQGNLSVIPYLTLQRNKEISKLPANLRNYVKDEDILAELNITEKLANNGVWWAVTKMYEKANNAGNADEAEVWMKRLSLRVPLSTPEGCSYLYHNIYKNKGESSVIEFVDMVAQENPQYVVNWVLADSNLTKQQKISFLRQAATNADADVRDEIDNTLRNKFGVTL